MKTNPRGVCGAFVAVVLCLGCAAPPPPESPAAAASPSSSSSASASDPRAIEIAGKVLERMGGRAAWEATRFVRWRFMDRRTLYWDRFGGDVRIEGDDWLVLLNVDTGRGRAWEQGQAVVDPEKLAAALDEGRQIWVNDAYWMFMPYKLLDPGATLGYEGERALEDGRPADVLRLTFAQGVGYTPQNRYDVYVARDTGLVEQWAFYADAADAEPRFTLPWKDWRRFGGILLATGHGRGLDWRIAVYDSLPRSVFDSPEPVVE